MLGAASSRLRVPFSFAVVRLSGNVSSLVYLIKQYLVAIWVILGFVFPWKFVCERGELLKSFLPLLL